MLSGWIVKAMLNTRGPEVVYLAAILYVIAEY